LLEHFWWGSIFLVNVPVVIISIPLVYRYIPTSRDPHPQRLDLPGSVLSMVGLSVLLWVIIGAPAWGWTSTTTIGGFVAAIALLGSFVAWELHTPTPMLDMTFFRDPRFTVACVSITMAFFSAQGSTFMNAQMFQIVFGYTPLETGIRMTPYILTFVLAAWLAPRINERLGTKFVVTLGLLIASGGMFLQLGVHVNSSYLRAILGLACMATGMGLATPPATEAIMGSLPREKAGVGSAMNDTARLAGGALGIAVLGSILATQYQSTMARAVSRLPVSRNVADLAVSSAASVGGLAERIGGRTGAVMLDVSRHAWLHGRNTAALVAGIMLLGGALLALVYLPAHAAYHHLNPTEVLPIDMVIDDTQLGISDDDERRTADRGGAPAPAEVGDATDAVP
jgi:MFS family permease